jgi:hypothetical protein
MYIYECRVYVYIHVCTRILYTAPTVFTHVCTRMLYTAPTTSGTTAARRRVEGRRHAVEEVLWRRGGGNGTQPWDARPGCPCVFRHYSFFYSVYHCLFVLQFILQFVLQFILQFVTQFILQFVLQFSLYHSLYNSLSVSFETTVVGSTRAHTPRMNARSLYSRTRAHARTWGWDGKSGASKNSGPRRWKLSQTSFLLWLPTFPNVLSAVAFCSLHMLYLCNSLYILHLVRT